MHIDAKSMPKPVNKVFAISGFFNNIAGCFINGGKGDSRLDGLDRCFIGFEHRIVNSHLLFCKLAKSEGAGNIRGIAVSIYADIEHKQVTLTQRSCTGHAVRQCCFFTG
ncbi:hypothetical protein D3C81_1353020 [compost metagenome]